MCSVTVPQRFNSAKSVHLIVVRPMIRDFILSPVYPSCISTRYVRVGRRTWWNEWVYLTILGFLLRKMFLKKDFYALPEAIENKLNLNIQVAFNKTYLSLIFRQKSVTFNIKGYFLRKIYVLWNYPLSVHKKKVSAAHCPH